MYVHTCWVEKWCGQIFHFWIQKSARCGQKIRTNEILTWITSVTDSAEKRLSNSIDFFSEKSVQSCEIRTRGNTAIEDQGNTISLANNAEARFVLWSVDKSANLPNVYYALQLLDFWIRLEEQIHSCCSRDGCDDVCQPCLAVIHIYKIPLQVSF